MLEREEASQQVDIITSICAKSIKYVLYESKWVKDWDNVSKRGFINTISGDKVKYGKLFVEPTLYRFYKGYFFNNQ